MAVFEVRGEHAVVSGEMGAGARHEGGEAGDEVDGVERDMSGSVTEGVLESIHDLPAVIDREAFVRERWAGNVAAIVLFCLLLLFSVSGWAEYKRGNQVCTDKSEEYYRQDSENLDNQYLYASCLVIKGEDDKGLPLLYLLADHKSLVTANFFLADYLGTDGKFIQYLTEDNIDEAIKYHLHTQAIISLIPTYPEPDYFFYERQRQMELNSVYAVPSIYLAKYELGVIGDYRKHLLLSPSYQGDRNKVTYPEYNPYMLDSLNKVVRYAGECASQPQKRHFDPVRYRATTEACRLLEERALTLIPLEEERQSILLQPHCKDLNKTNCPEYYTTHRKIWGYMADYVEKKDEIFKPVTTR